MNPDTSANTIEQNKDTVFEGITITADDLRNEYKATDTGNTWETLRITDATPIPPPIPVITINAETVAIEGGLCTISGMPKSGKSAFTSMILAGAISATHGTPLLDGMVVTANTEKKAVIHFDTEQARHKHQYNHRTILKRAGLDSCPPYFLSYNIRQQSYTEYRQITDEICEAASKAHGGIHLIVIDGMAEYISDTNDLEQSKEIALYFMNLSETYSTAVIGIIHTNKNSNTERGHLGSEVQRKSDSVIRITCEGDVSYLEPVYLRYAGKGDIPRISFRYDKECGYHVGCGVLPPKDEIDRNAIGNLEALCDAIYGGQKAYRYGHAIKAIINHTGKGENIAKGLQKKMREYELIIQNKGDKMWRINA